MKKTIQQYRSALRDTFLRGFLNVRSLILFCVVVTIGDIFASIALQTLDTSTFLGALGVYLLLLVTVALSLVIIRWTILQKKVPKNQRKRDTAVLILKTANVFFYFLMITLAITFLFANSLGIGVVYAAVIMLTVALNVLPEVAYLKPLGGFAMVVYTLSFMQKKWIEWLIPNLLCAGILGGVAYFTYLDPFQLGEYFYYIMISVSSILLYLVMVFRGFLFVQLEVDLLAEQALRLLNKK